jgi:hypothetical protein
MNYSNPAFWLICGVTYNNMNVPKKNPTTWHPHIIKL